LPCPCTALPCPVSNLPFATIGHKRRKLHKERAMFFFFPFAAKDRRRKLHKERAMFFFFPFAARDKRKKLHRERTMFFFFCCQGQEEEVTHGLFFFFPVGGSTLLDSVTIGGGVRFDGSLVAGMDETSVRLDDGSGERSQGLLHLLPQKYTGAESGVASPKAFIYKKIMP